MTWRTPDGDRVLIGHESTLIKESIASMAEELASCRETDDQPCTYGVGLFDELTWSQQLAVLNRLAAFLLYQTDDTLELTGVHEAAVAAVFRNVAQQIEIEIELDGVSPPEYRFHWRDLVVDAKREALAAALADEFTDQDETFRASQLDSTVNVTASWDRIVDSLADRVLWDRDFEMAGKFVDAPPEKAAAMKAMMGIGPEYYTAIAPDPADNQIDELFESLETLTRAKPR